MNLVIKSACYLLFSLLITEPLFAQEELNVYSARKEALIRPLLERFQQETGTKFQLITGKADALLKRMEVEGKLSPADLFITVDAGRLQRAKAAGVLQATDNPAVLAAVPAHLRDKENYWFGLSMRARTIIYASDRVDAKSLSICSLGVPIPGNCRRSSSKTSKRPAGI